MSEGRVKDLTVEFEPVTEEIDNIPLVSLLVLLSGLGSKQNLA